MKREVDIDEISDGRRYKSTDMVKISCNDCAGCAECCKSTGKTIILDPYDIYQLCSGLSLTFDELMSGIALPDGSGKSAPAVELNMADGILLPNIAMNPVRQCCGFLSDADRCTIHNLRPGFCRLYPLGRIYENGGFSYFNQIYECDYPNKSKVKIRKWIGIDNLPAYETFVLKWHDFLERVREYLGDLPDMNEVSAETVRFLIVFYRTGYDSGVSFYEQVDKRMQTFFA